MRCDAGLMTTDLAPALGSDRLVHDEPVDLPDYLRRYYAWAYVWPFSVWFFDHQPIIIAILFVVFDVEAIFIFPWAVIFNSLGLYGLVEMALFIGLLLLGWFYAWRKGAFEWA